MEKKYDVFISHSSKDKKVAKAMADFLNEKNLKCFLSFENIDYGTKYMEELIRGIEESKLMVLILTKYSNESEHVLREVNRALEYKLPVILFRMSNINLSKGLEYYFATFQWLDAVENKPEIYYEQLYAYVKGLPIPSLPKKLLLSKKIISGSLFFYFFITIAIFLVLGIPILKDYATINRSNSGHVRFIDAIKQAGITDIEPKSGNILPPKELYLQAKKEIFISGVTLISTLEYQREYLRNAVTRRNVKLKLVLLNPLSTDSIVTQKINNRDQSWVHSIGSALTILKDDSLFHKKNVEVRFCDKMPPITGIVIDGDIAPNQSKPDDSTGILRVSAYLWSPKHEDWIFQFEKINKASGTYEAFVSEFRDIWAKGTVLDKLNQ